MLGSSGVIYAARTGAVSWRCALFVVSPALVAGLIATVWTNRRMLATVGIVLAILATVTLTLNCAADRFAQPETVRDLVRSANAEGYAAAPLFMFEKIERTAEFYGAGRVAYEPNGEPVMFDRVSQIVNQARQTRGPILVIMWPGSVFQLSTSKEIKTTVIGTNGSTTLVAVRAD
jgi:hypothetical protein